MTSSRSARAILIEAAGARELSVVAGGSSTSALVAGTGRPLILLHGFNAAAGLVWWPVIAALSERFRVIAPDLPGLGESEALRGEPTIPRVVAWLTGVVEECSEEPVALVATSLSGGFALHFATSRADLIRDLILTDAQGLAPFRPSLGFLIATTLNRLRPSPASARMLARHVIHDERNVERVHGSLWDTFISYMVSQTGRTEVRRTMSGFANREMTRPLPDSSLETLQPRVALIWGVYDRPFPITIAEEANSRFGWPLEVIDDAGHLPYIEQPPVFVEAVTSLTG